MRNRHEKGLSGSCEETWTIPSIWPALNPCPVLRCQWLSGKDRCNHGPPSDETVTIIEKICCVKDWAHNCQIILPVFLLPCSSKTITCSFTTQCWVLSAAFASVVVFLWIYFFWQWLNFQIGNKKKKKEIIFVLRQQLQFYNLAAWCLLTQ